MVSAVVMNTLRLGAALDYLEARNHLHIWVRVDWLETHLAPTTPLWRDGALLPWERRLRWLYTALGDAWHMDAANQVPMRCCVLPRLRALLPADASQRWGCARLVWTTDIYNRQEVTVQLQEPGGAPQAAPLWPSWAGVMVCQEARTESEVWEWWRTLVNET